jgi:hypothetical protein
MLICSNTWYKTESAASAMCVNLQERTVYLQQFAVTEMAAASASTNLHEHSVNVRASKTEPTTYTELMMYD